MSDQPVGPPPYDEHVLQAEAAHAGTASDGTSQEEAQMMQVPGAESLQRGHGPEEG